MFSSAAERETRCFSGKHVLVTGASQGIGRSLCLHLAERGAKLTMVARTKSKLDAAATEVRAVAPSSATVIAAPCDCTDPTAVSAMLDHAEAEAGPVDVLVNCAGGAHGLYFEDLTPDIAEGQMKTNYFSQLYPTQAVFSKMKERGAGGHIVLTSSLGGLTGVFGYSAYTPAKFALRGLAECLYYEGKPHGINVTTVYPPDTDTPGLKNEKLSMPKESLVISGTAGLFPPTKVAAKIVTGIMRQQGRVTVGLDGAMLGIVTAGMSPGASLVEVILMPLMRFLTVFFVFDFNRTIARVQKERESSQESAGKSAERTNE